MVAAVTTRSALLVSSGQVLEELIAIVIGWYAYVVACCEIPHPIGSSFPGLGQSGWC